MFQIVETRSHNVQWNALHIADAEGRNIVTVWELSHCGQDELWQRAGTILDFLNQKDYQR